MNYDQFVEVFTTLYTETAIQNEFIASLPRSINEAFFDNEYTHSMSKEKQMLMKNLFEKPLVEEINYFLYDFHWGFKIVVGEKEYKPSNFDEILLYFKEQYYADV